MTTAIQKKRVLVLSDNEGVARTIVLTLDPEFEVVRIIMQDESLAAELGNGLLVLGKQKCPNNNHKCTSPFSCNKPFTCPKVHTVVEPTKKDVG